MLEQGARIRLHELDCKVSQGSITLDERTLFRICAYETVLSKHTTSMYLLEWR
jgi:hypothetical protein